MPYPLGHEDNTNTNNAQPTTSQHNAPRTHNTQYTTHNTQHAHIDNTHKYTKQHSTHRIHTTPIQRHNNKKYAHQNTTTLAVSNPETDIGHRTSGIRHH